MHSTKGAPRAGILATRIEMSQSDESLGPTRFIDSDHPTIVAFAKAAVGDATTNAEKVERLFRAVREHLRYDPYTVSFAPEDYLASRIVTGNAGYCVPKAVLLTAVLRAAGIPARIGFADVKNHLSSKKLHDVLGSDLFVFHGYVEVMLEGKPYKLTPAFNASLCARSGVAPLEFDPRAPADALLQSFDGEGKKYMEYTADRGTFAELPLDEILATFTKEYPRLRTLARERDEAFHAR